MWNFMKFVVPRTPIGVPATTAITSPLRSSASEQLCSWTRSSRSVLSRWRLRWILASSDSGRQSSTLGLSGQSSSYRRPLLEPRGTERNPAERIVDLSFEKVFPFSSRDRIGIYLQILNAFNASTITGTQNRVPSTSIAGISTPILYGAPGTITSPRQVNIGGRWSF